MSEVLSGRVSKHRRDRRVKNSTVLRMMAIMQEGNSEVPKEFLETGRTGRRNAMPDILHPQNAEASTADLPSRLQQLTAADAETQSSTSTASPADPKTPTKKDDTPS
ncbi:unnamed protein product [Spodoptera exigua]|uniref:cAMP-dependent protein kinase inhibitor beta n=2 Tax=Spodoptera TaxID=7106 RepID=A0A835KYZ7_SPOEX|nr:hypothetical protein HW555_011320 [Spodoptera exigua]CAH0698733.1 unnamed protein product [Spodoptera exigua]